MTGIVAPLIGWKGLMLLPMAFAQIAEVIWGDGQLHRERTRIFRRRRMMYQATRLKGAGHVWTSRILWTSRSWSQQHRTATRRRRLYSSASPTTCSVDSRSN